MRKLHLGTHLGGCMVEAWLSRKKVIHWLSGQLEARLAAHAALELGPEAVTLPCLMGLLGLLEEQMVCWRDL